MFAHVTYGGTAAEGREGGRAVVFDFFVGLDPDARTPCHFVLEGGVADGSIEFEEQREGNLAQGRKAEGGLAVLSEITLKLLLLRVVLVCDARVCVCGHDLQATLLLKYLVPAYAWRVVALRRIKRPERGARGGREEDEVKHTKYVDNSEPSR